LKGKKSYNSNLSKSQFVWFLFLLDFGLKVLWGRTRK